MKDEQYVKGGLIALLKHGIHAFLEELIADQIFRRAEAKKRVDQALKIPKEKETEQAALKALARVGLQGENQTKLRTEIYRSYPPLKAKEILEKAEELTSGDP